MKTGSPTGKHLERTPDAPGAVRWIVRTLEDAGHETWAVGGAVRDALLGLGDEDWDLATRARPAQVRRIFRRTVPIGIDHGTVGVLDRSGRMHEVTTFRRDVETFGRHAVVEYSDSIEEDLARRDFTINAMAWHPLREELRDPYGGRDDLAAGLLRTVGDPDDRFAEDFLRVLRALRFAGRFSLRITPDTWTALTGATDRLSSLSAERIREELMKVLGGSEPPSRSLSLYAASGALARVYPELEALVGHPRPGSAPGGLWAHALLAADAIAPDRPVLRIAQLLRYTGVPRSVPGQAERDEPPEERAGRRCAALMTRLRFSNADRDRVTGLARAGLEPPDGGAGGARLRRWLSRHGPDRLSDLARLWIASARADRARGRPDPARKAVAAWRALRGELASDPPLCEGDLALDGGDLIGMGLKPGPRFGEILRELLDRVLDDPSLNEASRLEELVRDELEAET